MNILPQDLQNVVMDYKEQFETVAKTKKRGLALLKKFVRSFIINRSFPVDPKNFDSEYNYRNDYYKFTNEDFVHIAIWFEGNIDENGTLDSGVEYWMSSVPTRKRIIKVLLNTYTENFILLPKYNIGNLKKLLKKMLYVTQLAMKKRENNKGFDKLYKNIYKIMNNKSPGKKSPAKPKKKSPAKKKTLYSKLYKKIMKKSPGKPKKKSMKNLSPQKVISSDMSVVQLKREVKKRGIKGYSKLKKSQLLRLLK